MNTGCLLGAGPVETALPVPKVQAATGAAMSWQERFDHSVMHLREACEEWQALPFLFISAESDGHYFLSAIGDISKEQALGVLLDLAVQLGKEVTPARRIPDWQAPDGGPRE